MGDPCLVQMCVPTLHPYNRQNMPVINIEDLTEKDKLKMEVDQLKKEVTLERMMVSGYSPSLPGGDHIGKASSLPIVFCTYWNSSMYLQLRCL